VLQLLAHLWHPAKVRSINVLNNNNNNNNINVEALFICFLFLSDD